MPKRTKSQRPNPFRNALTMMRPLASLTAGERRAHARDLADALTVRDVAGLEVFHAIVRSALRAFKSTLAVRK